MLFRSSLGVPSSFRPGGHRHPVRHAVNLKYAARDRASEQSAPARLRPGAHDLLADLLILRQHPLTFCDALRIFVREAAVVTTGVSMVTVVIVAIVIIIAVI